MKKYDLPYPKFENDNLNLIPKVVGEYSEDSSALTDDCAHPTIGYLIDNGYLKGAASSGNDSMEGRVMINPKTGDEMNGLLVCVRYDSNDLLNRKLVAYIIEE